MAPRQLFALIRTTNPDAVDVFRRDEVKSLDPGFENGATATVQKKSWHDECHGTILRVGTQTALLLLRVDATGKIVEKDQVQADGVYLTTRYKALCAAKLTERSRNLQNVAEALAAQGPGALGQVQPSKRRVPKPRSEAQIEQLKKRLDELPCFNPDKPGTHEITAGSGVWVNSNKLWGIIRTCSTRPRKMFIELAQALVCEEALNDPLLTVSGGSGTVQFPENILNTIDAFTLGNSKGIEYNRNEVLANHLYYRQHAEEIRSKKRARREVGQEATHEEGEAGGPQQIPTEMGPTHPDDPPALQLRQENQPPPGGLQQSDAVWNDMPDMIHTSLQNAIMTDHDQSVLLTNSVQSI